MRKKQLTGELTFDGYNKELKDGKSADLGVTLVNTFWYKDNQTLNSLENKKSGMESDTYRTILGINDGWLASRCVRIMDYYAQFGVYFVNSNELDANSLFYSIGNSNFGKHGVRPLIFLNAELFNGEGNGTSSSPWQLSK